MRSENTAVLYKKIYPAMFLFTQRQKKVSALEIENCTDVESCKLQIMLLLQKQSPAWLANSEGKVRTLVDPLAQEDEIARALDAGKRKLGKIDSQIMAIAKSLPI